MTTEEREVFKKELREDILAEVRLDLNGLEDRMNGEIRKLKEMNQELEKRINDCYALNQGAAHL